MTMAHDSLRSFLSCDAAHVAHDDRVHGLVFPVSFRFTAATSSILNSNTLVGMFRMEKSRRATAIRAMASDVGVSRHPQPEYAQRHVRLCVDHRDMATSKSSVTRRLHRLGWHEGDPRPSLIPPAQVETIPAGGLHESGDDSSHAIHAASPVSLSSKESTVPSIAPHYVSSRDRDVCSLLDDMAYLDKRLSTLQKQYHDIRQNIVFPCSRFTATMKVCPPTRRRVDPSNFQPTLKPFIDGLTDAAWWPDDDFTHCVETSFVYGGLSPCRGQYMFVIDINTVDDDGSYVTHHTAVQSYGDDIVHMDK